MKMVFRSLLATSALSLAGASPALADYALMEYIALPSVVFIEFSGDAAEPKVITAPSGSVSVVDPAPPVQDNDQSQPARSSGTASLGGPARPAASVNERVEKAISDLENRTDQDIEDDLIDEAVRNEIFDGATLR